jgi:hypothetical protein
MRSLAIALFAAVCAFGQQAFPPISSCTSVVCVVGTTTISPTTGVTSPAFTGTGSDPYANLPSNPSHTGVAGDIWNNAGVPTFFNKALMTVAGGQTLDSANTVTGLPSGCVQWPCRVATLSLTAQTTDIAQTTLYTPTATGVYRINTFIFNTTVATGGTWQSRIDFTPTSTGTNDAISPISATSLSAFAYRSIPMFVTSGNAITYRVTGSSITGSPQYSFYAVVERLN